MKSTILTAVSLSLYAALPAAADTLVLRSGEVLVADVLQVGEGTLELDAGYPRRSKTVIQWDELMPESVYGVLARRSDPTSAEARLALAKTSLELGLPAHAVAEYREAARLDPTLRRTLEAKVAELERSMAFDLLVRAQEAAKDARWEAAALHLESLVARYGDTPYAVEATRILASIESSRGKADRGRPVTPRELDQAIGEARRYEGRFDRLVRGKQNPVITTAKERRLREAGVGHLERAWKAIHDLAAPKSDSRYVDRFTALRTRIHRKLAGEYMALGTYFVGRRAVPAAEAYNVKACELDPEGEGCRRLQDLIVSARLSDGLHSGSGRSPR